jgi:hypothetical protein
LRHLQDSFGRSFDHKSFFPVLYSHLSCSTSTLQRHGFVAFEFL